MTEFRKTVQRRAWFGAALVLLGVAVFVWGILWLENADEAGHAEGLIMGFRTGAFLGIAAVAVGGMIRCIHALRDEEKLKKLYIEEHDERALLIAQLAGGPAMTVVMYGLALATLGASFVDMTVFLTLLLVLLFVLLVKLAFCVAANLRYSDEAGTRSLMFAKILAVVGLLTAATLEIVTLVLEIELSSIVWIPVAAAALLMIIAAIVLIVRSSKLNKENQTDGE